MKTLRTCQLGFVFAATLLVACGDPSDTGPNKATPDGATNNATTNDVTENNTPNNTTPNNATPNDDVPIIPGNTVGATPNEEYEELMSRLQAVHAMSADDFVQEYDPRLQQGLSYDATQAENLPIIQRSALALDAGELDVLDEHGFVVSTHHQFPSFVYGYETLYMQDLPLYVSADSILHAVHRSYDTILKSVEMRTLIPELRTLLDDMRSELAGGAVSGYPVDVVEDIDFYLAVARSLLDGERAAPVAGADPVLIDEFLQKATDAEGAMSLMLFGSERNLDFSQYEPRGHYTDSEELEHYFRAMMWLGRIDMRILEPNMENQLVFHRNQLEMAYALDALIDDASEERWAKIHDTIGAFVGEPDNMILPELDEVLAELRITDPAQLANVADQDIVDTFQKHGFGTQRISSHIMINGIHGETKPLSATFLLFGQRYVLDSHVFSNVVYDRVQGGTQMRMMPDPLDVAFAALDNDQAGVMMYDELQEYEYAPDLAAMRLLADAHREPFWQANIYNLWLNAIRTLSPGDDVNDFVSQGLPEITATEAWGRRILNTQLASWAELRHDTILYAKQSYTSGAACEFPDAYVDPYPEFYAAVGNLADHGLDLLADLGYDDPQVQNYFRHLKETMGLLEEMALYQRTGQPYTPAMLEFVNQAVVIQHGCGDPVGAEGWYPELFIDPIAGTQYDPTIADVHTQPTDEAGNPVGKVLHVGTGLPRLMVVTVDTCEGQRAYAGLASSYHEVITDDFERLNDEGWSQTLYDQPPAEVEWMQDLLTPVP